MIVYVLIVFLTIISVSIYYVVDLNSKKMAIEGQRQGNLTALSLDVVTGIPTFPVMETQTGEIESRDAELVNV